MATEVAVAEATAALHENQLCELTMLVVASAKNVPEVTLIVPPTTGVPVNEPYADAVIVLGTVIDADGAE